MLETAEPVEVGVTEDERVALATEDGLVSSSSSSSSQSSMSSSSASSLGVPEEVGAADAEVEVDWKVAEETEVTASARP